MTYQPVKKTELPAAVPLSEQDWLFHYGQLADFADAVFWVTSPDGQQVYFVSDTVERIWRRSRASLDDGGWLQAIHRDERPAVERSLHERAGDETWEQRYRIVTPEGEFRWIRDRRYPVPGASGDCLAGISLDVTETHKSQRRLEITQFAVQHIGDLLLWMNGGGRILYANAAACRLLGYSRKELQTKRPWEIGLVPSEEDWAPLLQKLGSEMPRTLDTSLRDRTGFDCPVELSATVLQFERETFCCVIARDSSARREAARALEHYARELERANETLRARNRELDEFAHLASHDLKEPLRAILTFSQLLQEDAGAELPHDARRDLGFIISAAGRMHRLIDDLLALSRAGRADLRKKRVRLHDCVESAMESLTLRAQETQAVVDIGELPEAVGDPTMLTLLFQNLLSNALKFRSDRPPVVQVGAARDGDQWVIHVKDNGRGMKPEHARERIFQPFRRIHPAPDAEGTGIGLTICRKIVERHGGRIWAESQPGIGTQFFFTLCDVHE